MANPTDFDLYYDQEEIEELAKKIQRSTPHLSWHQAWIKACRLLAQGQ